MIEKLLRRLIKEISFYSEKGLFENTQFREDIRIVYSLLEDKEFRKNINNYDK